jgi:hypothetical protein
MRWSSIVSVPIVEIPASEITDWESFHDVFARTLGFPDYYGRNMNAWIDCLTYADEDTGDIDSGLVAGPGDVLTLQVNDVKSFASRCREQYDALVEGAAFVNWRRIEQGARPVIVLSFHD